MHRNLRRDQFWPRLAFLCVFLAPALLLQEDNFGGACPGLLPKVWDRYAPIGNGKAGVYSEFAAKNLDDCVKECCRLEYKCNLAFMFNSTCYHLKCATNELCLPMKRSNITAELKMVLVNPVGEESSWLDILKQSRLGNSIVASKPDNYEEILYNPFDEADSVIPASRLDDLYAPQPYIGGDDLQPAESKLFDYSPRILRCETNDQCPLNEICVPLEGMEGFRAVKGKCVNILMRKIDTFPGSEDVDDTKTPKTKKQLTISVAPKTIRLPENSATLSAFVIPDEKTSGDKYEYLWTLISQPSQNTNGTMTDQTKDQVKLSNLAEGIYRFKLTVTGKIYEGESFANVTVLPINRINKPPQVIITPKVQTVKLPNSKAILDGSQSTDDSEIINYRWEVLNSPIGYAPSLPSNISTLQLDNLVLPGNYTFKLTVTDSDNVDNSTTAIITVLQEIDYPPEANAGPDVIIYLPQNNVTLNGTLSTDDHEIVSWEWTKDSNDQSKAVDMQNTRTPYLKLSNLEEGIYTFVLKVSDAKGQSSSSTVHVFVKPASSSKALKLGTFNNITITLPQNWATLDASESTADSNLKFNWQQISGPKPAQILNGNLSIANATQLTVGEYVFQLSASDDNGNKDSAQKKITVIQEKNYPPVANAGGDQTVTLPIDGGIIKLNGTKSTDDLGIVNYTWTRDVSSLAVGDIVGNSDKEAVLMLTNVVAGRYVFKLTVYDGQGLSSTDTVSIFVEPDPKALNLVELYLAVDAKNFVESELESLEQKLVLLAFSHDSKVHVTSLKVDQKNGHVVVVFYVETKQNGTSEVMSALEVERLLKEKVWRDYSILGTTVQQIRTAICQNQCSGHGVCNTETRACMCDTFWMANVFFYWGLAEANCDWSILYVIVCVFIIFLLITGSCWSLAWLCRRSVIKPRSRPKKQKYSLLGTHEEDGISYNRSTTLSDSDTDSDVLFETKSRTNGILKHNGDTKTTRLGRRIKT